jgi:hypothetical protein
MKRELNRSKLALTVVAALTGLLTTLHGEPQLSTAVERPSAVLTRPTPMDPDDVAGIVVSLKGPEAGVWVIAETNELPTKFVRVVVTNEDGRYVLPDLPTAGYEVFARGYGLVDSRRVKAWPGQQLFIGVMAAASENDTGSGDSAVLRPQGLERNLVMTMTDGDDVVPSAASESGDLKALLSGVDLRVPYPKGSFPLKAQSRVEDAKAGWKGRGVWLPFTLEGPEANQPTRWTLKLQTRPDPLAR